ncbi:MAG: transposase [Gemmatimonadales bacterium]|nr:transposase [Gemmatimonadota bacterium]MCL4213508.1 transposase [Gemmatimonadales bacterium]
MSRKQPKAYSLEFREEALRRLQEGTTSIRALAQETGVHAETLRNSRRDARVAGYAQPDERQQNLTEENRAPRSENARLKEEREILRTATAFFARDARSSTRLSARLPACGS